MLIYQGNASNQDISSQLFVSIFPLCFTKREKWLWLFCFYRGENILLFLVQTVGRQLIEQRQYRPNRSRVPTSRKAIPQDPGRYTCQVFLSHGVTCTMELREICGSSVFVYFVGTTRPWMRIHNVLRNSIFFWYDNWVKKKSQNCSPLITYKKFTNKVIWPSQFLMIPQ